MKKFSLEIYFYLIYVCSSNNCEYNVSKKYLNLLYPK